MLCLPPFHLLLPLALLTPHATAAGNYRPLFLYVVATAAASSTWRMHDKCHLPGPQTPENLASGTLLLNCPLSPCSPWRICFDENVSHFLVSPFPFCFSFSFCFGFCRGVTYIFLLFLIRACCKSVCVPDYCAACGSTTRCNTPYHFLPS